LGRKGIADEDGRERAMKGFADLTIIRWQSQASESGLAVGIVVLKGRVELAQHSLA